MTPKDSDGFSENDWDDSEGLGWSEADWDKFLRKQDDAIHRYLAFYESLVGEDDRLDKVARLMSWDLEENEDLDSPEAEDSEDEDDEIDPYVLQRNPVFVAASALYMSLTVEWEQIAVQMSQVPPAVSLPLFSSLTRGERHAVLGLQALDLGDYTMAVCLFKRALRELNATLNHVNGPLFEEEPLRAFHERAMVRLFDLRELLLRVIQESREELNRHSSSPGDEDGDGDKRGQA
jgi:hypothetical protein